MTSKNVTSLTDETFAKEINEKTLPVIVKFYAEWCAPCKALTPVFEKAAEEFHKKIKFCEANIDDCKNKISELQIKSLPTVIVYKKGDVAYRSQGAINKNILDAIINTKILGD